MRHAVNSRVGILRSSRVGLRRHDDATADDDKHNDNDDDNNNHDDDDDKHDNDHAGPDHDDDVPSCRLLHHKKNSILLAVHLYEQLSTV